MILKRVESVTGSLRQILTIENSLFVIELFPLTSDPHDQARFARRKRLFVSGLGRDVYLATAEDVIIAKLRWAVSLSRNKDKDDVQSVIAVQSDALDWSYIHHWCDQHGTRNLLDEIRASIPPLDT